MRKPETRDNVFFHTAYLLGNGYPHPDFAVFYGFHRQLNHQVNSYVLHMEHLLQGLYSSGEVYVGSLQSLAELFLLHQDMISKYGQGVGKILNVLELTDSATYFKIIEAIVKNLNSPVVWLQAVVVFFKLHDLRALASGKSLSHHLDELEYAGKTWTEVISLLRIYSGSDPAKHSFEETDINMADLLPEDVKTEEDFSDTTIRTSSASGNVLSPIEVGSGFNDIIELCNGYIGLFGKSIIPYITDFKLILQSGENCGVT